MAKETKQKKKLEGTINEKISEIAGDCKIAGAAMICTVDYESLEGSLGNAIKSALKMRGKCCYVQG